MGVVLTGGGSQLKHLKQLVEYITGMDTRIGYPSEHLAGDTQKSETSPHFGNCSRSFDECTGSARGKMILKVPFLRRTKMVEDENGEVPPPRTEANPMSSNRKTILERWVEKFKEFFR